MWASGVPGSHRARRFGRLFEIMPLGRRRVTSSFANKTQLINCHMRLLFLNTVTMVSLFAIGCGSKSANGPFGPPRASRLMAPFAGTWIFDFEKTLAAQKAAGATEEQLARLRRLHAANPGLGNGHPDLTFDGNVAVGAGIINSEYCFFGMHKHGSKTCGKAWYHEDRFDPGDMSKCYVRLEMVDGQLHMDVNMEEDLPGVNDPDLASEPPVESDVSKCEVDAKAGKKPGDWAIYVFTRRH